LRRATLRIAILCNRPGKATVTAPRGIKVGSRRFTCAGGASVIKIKLSRRLNRKFQRHSRVSLAVTFSMDGKKFQRKLTLKIKRGKGASQVRAAELGQAAGPAVLCRNSQQNTSGYPRLFIGQPLIYGQSLDAQWTIHETFVLQYQQGGWVSIARRDWNWGLATYGGGAVGGMFGEGWLYQVGGYFYRTYDIDWQYGLGPGWYSIGYNVYWWTGAWTGKRWVVGEHNDDTPPPDGTYRDKFAFCYIE
jgi:hypothetical protein